jgi:hypothetical protein
MNKKRPLTLEKAPLQYVEIWGQIFKRDKWGDTKPSGYGLSIDS